MKALRGNMLFSVVRLLTRRVTKGKIYLDYLKKWGNSYVLKVPPQIAKLYAKACAEVHVTIAPYAYKCPFCLSGLDKLEAERE